MNILNEGYNSRKNLFKSGLGAHIKGKNNKTYLDLTCGSGSILLGHNHHVFKQSIKDFLKNDYSNFALPNIHANKFSNNLKKIFPNFSKFIFCSSGAEANLKALRIARAVTGKDHVANVTGSWHGSIDQFLFKSDKQGKPSAISNGLEKNLSKNIIYLPYNDIEKTKKILKKVKKKISCVFFEPIQGCLPTGDNKLYIKFLSDFCKKNNILLMLDEIITGLRINCSNIQKIYKLKSDISTFGKVAGGGMPIGIIGISKKIEKELSNKNKKVFFGGTFSGNSLSTFVGNKTIEYLSKNKRKIFFKINSHSEYFVKNLNKQININNIKARVINFHSIVRLIFSEKLPKDKIQRDFFEKKKNNNRLKFIRFLEKNKIILPNNGIIFISHAMEKKHLQFIISKIIIGLKKNFRS